MVMSVSKCDFVDGDDNKQVRNITLHHKTDVIGKKIW